MTLIASTDVPRRNNNIPTTHRGTFIISSTILARPQAGTAEADWCRIWIVRRLPYIPRNHRDPGVYRNRLESTARGYDA